MGSNDRVEWGNMADIIEYAQQELLTFDEAPLNEVDSLVFSQLSYFWFGEAFPDARGISGRALHDAFHLEAFDPLFVGKRAQDQNQALLAAIAASPRYRDVRVCSYVAEFDRQSETQFSAAAFILPGDAESYIAFRGTDSTLVGWKEDFNLAYRYPVRGQVLACSHVNRIADAVSGPLYLGGHSKGGNLAVYAATQCSAAVQDRIVAVYDHDAPGFASEFFDQPSFARIRPRIRKTVPEDALVGMLMETPVEYRVVRSDAVAMLQHDPFTWEVDIPAREFAFADGVSRMAGRGDAVISKWIEPLDAEQRGAFIDTLFRALTATGAHTTGDLLKIGRPELAALTASLVDTDPETRRIILEVLGRLARLFFTPQATWELLDSRGGEDAAL